MVTYGYCFAAALLLNYPFGVSIQVLPASDESEFSSQAGWVVLVLLPQS